MRQTTLPRHLATPKAKLMARVGEEFPLEPPPDELPDIDIHSL